MAAQTPPPSSGGRWPFTTSSHQAARRRVAPLNPDNLPSCGECKRIITTSLETPHEAALADFLITQSRLFASPTAEARLRDAVTQFETGGRPSLDTGWFPLGLARSHP